MNLFKNIKTRVQSKKSMKEHADREPDIKEIISREYSDKLIGKCGFYCGSCPTYIAGNCKGCIDEHQEGDCFTRDCVIERKLSFCGECREFPCETILTRPHTTVLDKDWLQWKKNSDTNR